MSRVRFGGEPSSLTAVQLDLNLDGEGKADIDTGIGFLDHMLSALTKHARFDLKLRCKVRLRLCMILSPRALLTHAIRAICTWTTITPARTAASPWAGQSGWMVCCTGSSHMCSAFNQALGERRGIARFGSAYAPLDEALSRWVAGV